MSYSWLTQMIYINYICRITVRQILTNMAKDYHYILGIRKDASKDEIKSAYRKLSKKFHPDLNPNDKYFEERFKDIQEAYEFLSKESVFEKENDSNEIIKSNSKFATASNITVDNPILNIIMVGLISLFIICGLYAIYSLLLK